MRKALLAGISAALVLGAVAGCVVETVNAPPSGVAVSGPPPEPMREMRPPPPQGGSALWVVGYWHWTGMQYTWIPGHWVVPPAGARWRAPRYSLHDGTYFYEQGGWTGPR
jgi:hypothetical protein